MVFDYEPIFYGQIKEGIGKSVRKNTQTERLLNLAIQEDHYLSDVYRRIGEKRRRFNEGIVWEDMMFPTVTARILMYRGTEKTWVSKEDVIHAQTFPEDYNFGDDNIANVGYICGMSVPPIMIKRIVTRMIESGVYN